jgi:hypothetical protein
MVLMADDEDALRVWIEDFLFGAALYAEYQLPDGAGLRLLVSTPLIIDGHCPYCQQSATFHRRQAVVDFSDLSSILKNRAALFLTIECARASEHKLIFILRFVNQRVQKFGQYPSLADIANDESRQYRKILSSADAADLHKAIGLAAHGVGIGAFVYLRRVFERLIFNRFLEYKDVEGWNDDEFGRLRMADRIEFLKGHLPDFLIRNKPVYSVLSLGIHELSEKQCLEFFEFLKLSTFYILDDDRRKREELDSRKKVEKAIAAIARSAQTK